VLLKFQVFWGVILCHGVSCSDYSKDRSALETMGTTSPMMQHNSTQNLSHQVRQHYVCLFIQNGAKYPPYFQYGIMKRGEAVEGWDWARKVQIVGKFPLQNSAVVKMVWSNEQRAFAVEIYFSQSLYRSGAACAPYSVQNPPSGPSTVPKIHSVVGWELQGNGKCVWKKMRTTTDLSNTRELWGCQTVRCAVSQALCTQTTATTCMIFYLRLCDLKHPML